MFEAGSEFKMGFIVLLSPRVVEGRRVLSGQMSPFCPARPTKVLKGKLLETDNFNKFIKQQWAAYKAHQFFSVCVWP